MTDITFLSTKVFPNQSGYFVNWLGGTGGGFLTTLVYLYATQDTKSFYINENARGHHNIQLIDKNWSDLSKSLYHEKQLHKNPVYEIIEPNITTNPIFLYDHYPCDPERFFSIYPKCKLIVIAIDEYDKLLCYANLFFKSDYDQLFQNLKQHKPLEFGKYETRYDIPLTVLQEHIMEAKSCIYIESIFNKQESVPEKYKDRIYKLDFKKLISDKNYIMDNLSTITNGIHSSFIDSFIDEYISKQKNLVATRLPWLFDYFYNT